VDNELSNINSWREVHETLMPDWAPMSMKINGNERDFHIKRTRRRYDRAFKISVVAELESGKPLAEIARERSIHPSLPSRWREELAENPDEGFSGSGNKYNDQARIAELERLLGQAHAEIELLKKAFAITQKKVREGRIRPM